MLARLAFVAALLVPVAAGATDFQTVDKVSRNASNTLSVTGLPVGSSTSTTVNVQSGDPGNTCEKYALIAMTHPGRYILTVLTSGTLPYQCALAPQTP